MKKLIRNAGILFFLFNIAGVNRVIAQDDATLLSVLCRDDSADVNTLAGYPEATRQAIFDLSSHPEAITRLHDLRVTANDNFKNTLSGLTRDDQQKLYNLARYDGLFGALSKGGKKMTPQVREITKDYPTDITNDAIYCNEQHSNLLSVLNQQHEDFLKSYNELVNTYSTTTQSSFNELLYLPEIINILAGNMEMTVRLGDLYKRNPDLVKKTFTDINLELARQKAKDTEEWKETMKNNPEAAKELQDAAKEYAKDQGYSNSDYQETNPVIIEHYHYVAYPYWAGYPWWYSDPYWYPYPYWYHWGFYYWHGEMIWTGYPSWYFMSWHFNHAPCFYNYPHLTNEYVNYYYGPRRAAIANTRVVRRWAGENRQQFTSGFMNNDGKRVDRIREYGKLEMSIDKIKKENPTKTIDRNLIIREHKTDYPTLQPVIRDQKVIRNTNPVVVPDRNTKDIRTVPPPDKKITDPKKVTPGPKPPVRQQPSPPIKKTTPAPAPPVKKEPRK